MSKQDLDQQFSSALFELRRLDVPEKARPLLSRLAAAFTKMKKLTPMAHVKTEVRFETREKVIANEDVLRQCWELRKEGEQLRQEIKGLNKLVELGQQLMLTQKEEIQSQQKKLDDDAALIKRRLSAANYLMEQIGATEPGDVWYRLNAKYQKRTGDIFRDFLRKLQKMMGADEYVWVSAQIAKFSRLVDDECSEFVNLVKHRWLLESWLLAYLIELCGNSVTIGVEDIATNAYGIEVENTEGGWHFSVHKRQWQHPPTKETIQNTIEEYNANG